MSMRIGPSSTPVRMSQQDFATQLAQQIVASLQVTAPQLAAHTQQQLAMNGMALPPTTYGPGQRPANITAMMLAGPAAGRLKSGVALQGGLPHPEYFSKSELGKNIDATFGKGSAALGMEMEHGMAATRGGLALALQGGSPAQISQLLGGGPRANTLANKLHKLAGAMTQQPPNIQRIISLNKSAEGSMLDYMAGGDAKKLAGMKKLQGLYGQGASGAMANEMNAVGAAPSVAGGNALQVAQSQVGVREATGRNDGIPSQRYMNGRKEPWCANFVAWSFRQAGTPLPGNQRSLASVQNMEDQMRGAGKLVPGGGNATPQPGDVIFFKNRGDSDRGRGRHVGIVEKVENGRVYTVEGNSGNAVARRSYPLGHHRIANYGRM